MKGVYLLHFERPYKHARHYVGYSDYIQLRVEHHRNGTSNQPLMNALREAGIGFEVARIWEGKGRTWERRIKGTSSSRLCPICNPDGHLFRAVSEQPFRHLRRKHPRKVLFTKAELKTMRRGYREGRKGHPPKPGKLYGAYMRGYRKGAATYELRLSQS